MLDLLAKDRSNAEIAAELGISLDGAKWHVREVLTKLGAESRDEAAEYWRVYNGWRLSCRRIFGRTVRSVASRGRPAMNSCLEVEGAVEAVGLRPKARRPRRAN